MQRVTVPLFPCFFFASFAQVKRYRRESPKVQSVTASLSIIRAFFPLSLFLLLFLFLSSAFFVPGIHSSCISFSSWFLRPRVGGAWRVSTPSRCFIVTLPLPLLLSLCQERAYTYTLMKRGSTFLLSSLQEFSWLSLNWHKVGFLRRSAFSNHRVPDRELPWHASLIAEGRSI